jgi:hypothetical protein
MGAKVISLVALVAGLAALGDVLRNPGGTKAAFAGTNSLLATSYNAAGGYKA